MSSSLLSRQPLGSTSPSMLDLHRYWIEYSRLVDVFRRVGKLGGTASLTASTKDGLCRASLEIQTRRHPRPNLDLSAPQLPNLQHHTRRMLQDAVAPDVVEDQPRLFGPERARGLTRLPLQPADKAPVRLRLPESETIKLR